MLVAFRVASSTYDNPRNQSVCMTYQLWKAPDRNELRMDVDVGCNTIKKIYSAATAIRNSAGRVLGASAMLIRGSGLVFQAKLEANM